jgi:hypothetical protein
MLFSELRRVQSSDILNTNTFSIRQYVSQDVFAYYVSHITYLRITYRATMLLKVQLMPLTGNILVVDITDPESLVLEARSGKWYPRDQIENQEFLE